MAGFGSLVTILMSNLNQSLGCSWKVDLESFGKLRYRKPFSQELSRELKLSEGSHEKKKSVSEELLLLCGAEMWCEMS